MKILELEQLLPRLNETAKDVDSWEEEFLRLMKLANIGSPATRHSWAMECVEGKLRGVLQDLVTTDEQGEEVYPTIRQMKEALEEALEITPQLKCKFLQRIKIRKGESVKNFNWRYKKLYTNLPENYKSFITVEDYTESIIYRPYARAQVITKQCRNLEEAFAEAELAERAENLNTSRSFNDTVMTTLYYKKNHKMNDTNHPYKFFRNSNKEDFRSQVSNAVNPTNQSSKLQKFSVPTQGKANNSSYKEQRTSLRCHKCNQPGHFMNNCPYTYQELARMEEAGKLNYKNNNYLNYKMEEGKLP